MPDQHDRSGIDVDRADRQVIEQAAAQLRQGAIRAGYAGLAGQHFAFALALVLDELALHVRDLKARCGCRSSRVSGRCSASDDQQADVRIRPFGRITL